MNFYRAYGLTLASEIELTELNPQQPSDAVDITISFGTIRADAIPELVQLDEFTWACQGNLLLIVPDVATYHVKDGRQIVIDLAPGANAANARLYLLGSCLGAALMQRGYLVLHGNAIRVGDDCVVCVGPSGAGKSTLSAAFMMRGFQILGDDVAVIDDNLEVLPGLTRIKLWEDAAVHLNIATSGYPKIAPGLDKYDVPVPASISDRAARARWIYVLDKHNGAGIKISAIAGHERFVQLIKNTYRPQFMAGFGLGAEHLLQCGRLSNASQLVMLRRPSMGFHANAVVDAILDDIGQTG